MPNPEEGRFQVRTPKGPEVRVGEGLVITTRVSFDELALRVQILEQVIASAPFIQFNYLRELRRAGLERRELITRTSVSTS